MITKELDNKTKRLWKVVIEYPKAFKLGSSLVVSREQLKAAFLNLHNKTKLTSHESPTA